MAEEKVEESKEERRMVAIGRCFVFVHMIWAHDMCMSLPRQDVHLNYLLLYSSSLGNTAIRPVAGVDPATLYAKIKAEIVS